MLKLDFLGHYHVAEMLMRGSERPRDRDDPSRDLSCQGLGHL